MMCGVVEHVGVLAGGEIQAKRLAEYKVLSVEREKERTGSPVNERFRYRFRAWLGS